MDYQDYYQTLGVGRTATPAEIKKAYRRLARELHPDRNPGDQSAERRFKAVNEAHAVLADPEKRKRYDALGANWEAFTRAGGGDPFAAGNPFAGFTGGGGGGRGNVRWEFRSSGSPGGATGDAAGFSDFFRMVFGDAAATGSPTGGRARGGVRPGTTADSASFADILSQMGWEGTDAAPRAARGGAATREPDAVDAPAELTLEEAFHGTTRVVDVAGRRYEVTIPRGADTGSRIRLSGKGPGGRDLVVTVRLVAHPVFARRGADLERELLLTLEEALLGAEIPVTTLKGRILLTIPPGTQNGRQFRLTGQGMPRMRGEGAGDLYVRVRVLLPTALDDRAREAARQFLQLAHQPDPRADR